MQFRPSALSALLALLAGPALAQVPDSAEIEAARKRGAESKSCDVVTHGKSFGKATGFDLVVLGPLNRVECGAAAAAKKYMQMSAEDSEALIQGGTITIVANPIAPLRWSDGSWHVTSPAKHAVLFDGDRPIQPDSIQLVPAEWGNAVGGKFQSTGIRAWFPTARVPAGEFAVAVVTEKGEFRFKIGKKDRLKIQ